MNEAGAAVVVWPAAADVDVFGQRVSSAGATEGFGFSINVPRRTEQRQPDVTVAPDGAFVAA